MLIGELSKKTGVSKDTIRFYEKEGLIEAEKPVRKGFFSNSYKDYTQSTAATLFFIQRAKALGFTLAEIGEMLALRVDGRFTKERWSMEAEAKLLVIDRKIEDLRELKGLLGNVLASCIDRCFEDGCGILDDAVAKKVHGQSNSVEAPRACC